MAYERMGAAALDYQPCRYPGSKLLFRGPRRRLDGAYAACLGGTETYGKFIADPWPALLERDTGLTCVNFGWPNAGVDVFLNDTGVLRAATGARLVILQVPGAQNLSNRFYKVHPRRNDRFLRARGPLRAAYPEVDFTEFHFTRHLLGRLQARSANRFAPVLAELQELWCARMRLLLRRLDVPVVLLWLSGRAPGHGSDSPGLSHDPAFVTREMLADVRRFSAGCVEVLATRPPAQGASRVTGLDNIAALQLPDAAAHRRAAAALVPVVTGLSHQ
ncbi:DUF6473 family protein [Roseovarius sp. SYSU LYC5161]|uniref:DUF6473 family protein n=1 Tax=Roseovarius halophilus (ex Wu et al. 2025) TaxID=3376060 RepID=UPI00399BC95D